MKIDIEKIIIDKKQVLNFLGYSNRKIPLIIMKKVDEEIEAAYDLLKPVVFSKKFQIDKIEGDDVYFEEEDCLKGEYLAKELENSSSIYLVVYTIGNNIEEKINEYSSNSEMIRAMILDKIGVVALDNIRHQIKELIIEEVIPYKISAQLFPGSKDINVSNQKIIFDVFKEENNIISISKYYQLNPIKTVAMIFGIGKIEDKQDMCDRCNCKCSFNIK